MRIPRKAAALGLAVVASAAIATVPATSASAASSTCWDAGFRQQNGGGGTQEAFYCYNVAGTPVYAHTTAGEQPIGTLYTGTNWFVCSLDYGDYVGGPHPYRWLYTEADNGVWGWVRDTDIYSETDPIAACDGTYS